MARWKVIEEKFKNLNKDITFLDAITLLEHYGYDQDNKGKKVVHVSVLHVMDIVTYYCIGHIQRKNLRDML